MSLRAWNRVLGGVAALGAAVLVVKYFVADVYRVETPSMRPTLFGGRDRPEGEVVSEHVLVRYRAPFVPARFDLVVLESSDGGPPLVKRVVGLPGEAIAIRGGDLFVGSPGAHLAPDAPHPGLVTLFDQRWLDVGLFFAPRGKAAVTRENEEWVVGDATGEETVLEYFPELRDGYLDRDHVPVEGIREVNDARLAAEVSLADTDPGARLTLFLVEEGDRFDLELERGAGGTLTARLLRRRPPAARDPDAPVEVLQEQEVDAGSARWMRVSWSNVDDVLEARLDPPGHVLRLTYGGNRPWPRPELAPGRTTRGPRAGFAVTGGRVRLRGVVLARDLYYTDVGTYALGAPLHLGPDECFLLGDNSSVSTDSRHFGPVPVARLLGTAEAVVWPSWRRLRPVEEAP